MSKRICSVYFSPTGGTKKVVNTISSVLGDKLSLPVEIFDFTLPKGRENQLVFNSDDIVVIGTPVYAGRVPNVLLKFLDTMKGEGAIAVPVVVFGNRNYDEALCELSEICKKSKMKTITAGGFVAEHAFSYILGKGRPDNEDIEKISEFAILTAEKINNKGNDFENIEVDGGPVEKYYRPLDNEGNFIDITLNVYVDGTAPELAQNVINLEVDASGISIDDINTDDAEKIAAMLHELPDFSNAEWAAASDAFCGDNVISYEFEQKSFNLQKENPVEVLNVHCTVQDQAGNENEADYEVMVTYTGLDAEALLEKTGLIMQIADTSTNNNSTSSNNNMTKSDGKSNKNQNGEYKGNDTVNDLGMTDAEFAAMFDSMTPEEREAFLNSVAYGSTTDNNVQVSGYYDNNMAQEVFNLTNQERANNGLPAYSWDSNMASYSDRRAKEIVTDYSHNSAGGNWSVGENIAEGETSASEVVNDWMNSAGHKANILSDVSTKTSVSCYVENFTYADGSTQYLYHWVQNFTH